MKICQFNFNNEVDTFEIHVEEDGTVQVPGTDGQILAQYASVGQLAEMYAMARDVKAENLKNWVLLENGNVYSFVLRAGTAGLTVEEARDRLEETFRDLRDRRAYHPLAIARVRDQIFRDASADITDALVHCTETEVANAVYDALEDVIQPDETQEEVEEEDTRTDAERFLDDHKDIPGVVQFVAGLVGQPVTADPADILAAVIDHPIFSDYATLNDCYENAVKNAMERGIGVNTVADALTVMNQVPAYPADETAASRIRTATLLAGRRQVNLITDIVGETHIRHTITFVSLDELDGLTIYTRSEAPLLVRFDASVDEELEAEANGPDEDAEDTPEEGNGAENEETENFLEDFFEEENDEDDEEGRYY